MWLRGSHSYCFLWLQYIHVKVLEQINLFCVNPYVYIVRCYYSTNRVFVDLFFTEVRNAYNVFWTNDILTSKYSNNPSLYITLTHTFPWLMFSLKVWFVLLRFLAKMLIFVFAQLQPTRSTNKVRPWLLIVHYFPSLMFSLLMIVHYIFLD